MQRRVLGDEVLSLSNFAAHARRLACADAVEAAYTDADEDEDEAYYLQRELPRLHVHPLIVEKQACRTRESTMPRRIRVLPSSRGFKGYGFGARVGVEMG